ncbi:4Fe-4S dicluster domain-containing protein [Carboxylicivirga sp. A043]|uniref:4Fe-4S dicluster domain-containing protein n=1 Tax=Carboxylicivirga litoralis TaxID=2816963 RepID=UPI0021CB3690|nr:4Fe-4S dicluster domain-containing protein [Carboxylicivirga sp. A043]MCU4155835.1 4Fe-4S dicluster domain-containing protein [Carboxylicivirga sp. A043]
MNYKHLKKTRVIFSLLFFILTISLFLDIYENYANETVHETLFLQFMPSLMKFISTLAIGSVGFIIVIALTAFMGRLYCSAICPLGILQDVFAWIAKKRSSRKFFYKKKKAYPILRYTLLGLTVLGILLSFSTIVTLLDPYSNFGRIITYLVRPVVVAANNGLSMLLHKVDVYTLSPVKLVSAPWFILLFTAAVLMTIAYMSYKRGRLFCNTICPVGTFLGLFSKISFLKIQFDESNCTKCGKCIGECKSECIDIKNFSVDYSRCVDCFNCVAVCNDSALKLTSKKPQGQPESNDTGRRSAIATGVALLVGQKILAETKPGAKDTSKLLVNEKEHPVAPPGAISIKRFNEICTACGLCIAACPTQVLQPAVSQYGLKGFMQPHMDYVDGGYCNFDCRGCGQVCPTGAILPIEIEEKQLTQLGKAVFVKENCVVYTDGTDCGACSEHCPTKAVNMVPYEGNLLIPEVNQDICIGCGACEHPCPLDAPFKAIYVEGNAVHQAAEKPQEEEQTTAPVEEDFPF